MRTGVVVSAVAHAVIIGWGLISLPRAFENTAPVETLPVELVTLAELTDLAAGSRTAEPNPPAPETAPEPEPPPPPPPPPPERPAPQPEPEPAPVPPPPEPVAAAPALTPIPPPAPEPIPAPPPEPAPVLAPPPPAPPRVAAAEPAPTVPLVPSPVPRGRPRTPAPQTTASIPTPPAPTPAPPPTRTPTPQLSAPAPDPFNAAAIAALIDRSPPASPAQPTPAATPGLGITDGRFDAAMTQNELAALRERIMSCWSMPQGALNAAELRTEVHMRLNPDGSLTGQPEIVSRPYGRYQAIGPESVVRAIIACAPYNLPADKYAQWQEIILDFNPTDMFGPG